MKSSVKLLGVMFLLSSLFWGACTHEKTSANEFVGNANALLDSIFVYYQQGKVGLFNENYPKKDGDVVTYLADADTIRKDKVAYLWPTSGVFSAVNALLKATSDTSYAQLLDTCIIPGLHCYVDTTRLPVCYQSYLAEAGHSDRFYDDNIWLGIDYVESYGKDSFQKIYCYEICQENIDKMKINLKNFDNIEIKRKAVSDRRGKLKFDLDNDISSNHISLDGKIEVEGVALDEDIKEKISMVKMDIEGSEMKALAGMKKHIKNDTPILLISVYHNNTDLVEIPKYIRSLNGNYDYYLRYYGGCVYATEIVLFALPKKEKNI